VKRGTMGVNSISIQYTLSQLISKIAVQPNSQEKKNYKLTTYPFTVVTQP